MGKHTKKNLRKLQSSERTHEMMRDMATAREQERSQSLLEEASGDELFMIDAPAAKKQKVASGKAKPVAAVAESEAESTSADASQQRNKAAERRQKKKELKKKNKKSQQFVGLMNNIAREQVDDEEDAENQQERDEVDDAMPHQLAQDITMLQKKKKRVHRKEMEMGRLGEQPIEDMLLSKPVLPAKTTQQFVPQDKAERDQALADKRLEKKAKNIGREMQSLEAKQPSLKRKREELEKVEGKVYDLWDDEETAYAADEMLQNEYQLPLLIKARPKKGKSETSSERVNMTNKMKLILPHAGQSINPQPEAYREALKEAFTKEMEREIEARELRSKFEIDLNDPMVRSGGDDVLDGFKAREEGEEEATDGWSQLTDEEKQAIAQKLKAKVSIRQLGQRARINKATQEKQKKFKEIKKKFNQDVENMDGIWQELEQKHQENVQRKQALKQQKKEELLARFNPVQSAADVQLAHEMKQSISQHDGNAFYLFKDVARMLKNAHVLPEVRGKPSKKRK